MCNKSFIIKSNSGILYAPVCRGGEQPTENDLFVAKLNDYGLQNSLRISIGEGENCSILGENMKCFMETVNAF